jgi:hypothetical protein
MASNQLSAERLVFQRTTQRRPGRLCDRCRTCPQFSVTCVVFRLEQIGAPVDQRKPRSRVTRVGGRSDDADLRTWGRLFMTNKRIVRARIAAAVAGIGVVATRVTAPHLFALSFLLAWGAQAIAQAPQNVPVPAPPSVSPSAEVLKNWRHGMVRASPPQTECFTASYPDIQWQEVPCGAAPTVPNVNGGPVAEAMTGSDISTAVGSFDSVSGVTSVTSIYDTLPVNGDYTLQLNTNTFTPSLCVNAQPTGRAPCYAWRNYSPLCGGLTRVC